MCSAADELVDAAIPLEDRIHDIRKAAKQGRALLKLAPAHLHDGAREQREALRNVRKSFGAARDARVSLTLLQHYSGKSKLDEDAIRAAQEKLALHCETEEAAISDTTIGEATERLNACIAGIEGWDTPTSDDAELIEHVLKNYRKARVLIPAIDAPLDDLHAFRSAVVDHRYQMAFLAEADGKILREREAQVQILRENLGDYLDIERVRELLVEHGVDAKQIRALRRGQKKRLEKALESADELFSLRTRELRKTLTILTG